MHKFIDVKLKRSIIALLGIVGIICLSFLYYKIHSIYHIGIPCVFYELTGLYCAGCGITRAIFSLIRLDFLMALHNNILIIIVGPVLLSYGFIRLKEWILMKEEKTTFPSCVWYILIVIMVIFGILRNFSYFEILQPIN